jgi:hypothetical protein
MACKIVERYSGLQEDIEERYPWTDPLKRENDCCSITVERLLSSNAKKMEFLRALGKEFLDSNSKSFAYVL